MILKKKANAIRRSSPEDRIEVLKNIKNKIKLNEEAILNALAKDLGKPKIEAFLTEISSVIHEINYIIKNLKLWMKPKSVSAGFSLMGTKNWIQYEPKGLVLILAPWNYPFNLSLTPIIASIAAGNFSFLKPSEFTPNTSKLIKDLFSDSAFSNWLHIELGDADLAKSLTELPFDHIFFTGSTSTGQKVMQAASRSLTPVTLELGGKSPLIIDESIDLEFSAERIVWGKFLNCGQTCVAPDYILIPEERLDLFTEILKKKIKNFYGETFEARLESTSLGKIIHKEHFTKIKQTLDDAIKNGAKLYAGGESNEEALFIDPTILINPPLSSQIMKEEIFGPLLPVLSYKCVSEVFECISLNPNPLALYVFSDDDNFCKSIADQIPSGAFAINTIATHLANSSLPFGGVGKSGIGKYHGKFGFEEFSHLRAYHKMPRLSALKLFLPPYDESMKDKFNKVKNMFYGL